MNTCDVLMARGLCDGFSAQQLPLCQRLQVERANIGPREIVGDERWTRFEDRLLRFVMETAVPRGEPLPSDMILRMWVEGGAAALGWEALVDGVPRKLPIDKTRDPNAIREIIRRAAGLTASDVGDVTFRRVSFLTYWRWGAEHNAREAEGTPDYQPYADALQRKCAAALGECMTAKNPKQDAESTLAMFMVGLAADDAYRERGSPHLHPVLLNELLPLAGYCMAPQCVIENPVPDDGGEFEFEIPMGTLGLSLATPASATKAKRREAANESTGSPVHLHMAPRDESDLEKKLLPAYELSVASVSDKESPLSSEFADGSGQPGLTALMASQAATLSGATFLYSLDPDAASDNADPLFGVFVQVRYDYYHHDESARIQREDLCRLWKFMSEAAKARALERSGEGGSARAAKRSRSKHVEKATRLWSTMVDNIGQQLSTLTLAAVTWSAAELVKAEVVTKTEFEEESRAWAASVPTITTSRPIRSSAHRCQAVDCALSHANILAAAIDAKMERHSANDKRASEDCLVSHTNLLVAALAAWPNCSYTATSTRAESLVRTAAMRIDSICEWQSNGTMNAGACMFRVKAEA